ncbi:MAG: tetratricopeptide repeat protein, partial [Candidatus Latescibacteria bacterium]|nr:tetratricopeptide repeat protein [Candidatus Latescibacterota bacterium]
GEDRYRYGMAILQRKRGEIAEAEKNALAALHINPNDPLYGTLVGEIYTERGAPTLAIIEYEKVLQQPGLLVRAPVHHELGLLYEKEERYNEALEQYHEAVRKDSTYADAWKSMAELYDLAGRERDAAQTYLRYTELRQDDWEGYLGLAQTSLEANLNRPALDAARQAFSLDSTNVEIRLALARASFVNNDKARAQRLYTSLPDTIRFEPVDYVRMGQIKLDRNDLEAAAVDLRQAIDMDSTQADAYFALGLLELKRGEADSAVVQFEKTIEVNPRHSAAQLNLGVAWLQLGQPCKAIAPLRAAVDAAPNYTPARVYTAMSLVNCSEDSLSAAVAEYKAAIEQEPANATALRGLGFCYLKRGDCAPAADVLKPATEHAPNNADGWAMLGQAQAICGNLDAATRSFKKALEINAEHPTAKQGLQTIEAQQQGQ